MVRAWRARRVIRTSEPSLEEMLGARAWLCAALALALCTAGPALQQTPRPPVLQLGGGDAAAGAPHAPALLQHRRAARERERRMCEGVAVERMARVAAASRQRSAWEQVLSVRCSGSLLALALARSHSLARLRQHVHLQRRREDASFQVLKLESFKRQLKTLAARFCSDRPRGPRAHVCGRGRGRGADAQLGRGVGGVQDARQEAEPTRPRRRPQAPLSPRRSTIAFAPWPSHSAALAPRPAHRPRLSTVVPANPAATGAAT